MRSSDRSKALDLDRDLPTTAEDVAALRRVSRLQPLDLDAYLRFLSQLPALPATSLRARHCPKDDLPFELDTGDSGTRHGAA